ncbi:DUF1396 domain-containing protein [Streptomyces sp. NPDC001868]|uniref:DUF1396 domain-containing protein n=1 Tax=Streptomyces sp. NPDC001868 TaxID=3154401 RepID=UPI003318C939
MRFATRGSARRQAVGAATAVALLAGASACTDGSAKTESSREKAVSAVTRAADHIGDVFTLRYRMAGRTPKGGLVEAEAERRPGSTFAMVMNATSFRQGADGRKWELRAVDRGLYIGGETEVSTADQYWTRFDLDTAREMGDPKAVEYVADDPVDQSTFLVGSEDVERLGTRNVDGVKTTHYRGTVSRSGLRAALKGESEAVRERRYAQFVGLGAPVITVDQWIDGADRTKRFRIRATGATGAYDMTVTFVEFDQGMLVEPPPEGDTFDPGAPEEDVRES